MFRRSEISQRAEKSEAGENCPDENYQAISANCVFAKNADEDNEQFIDSGNYLISGSYEEAGFLLTTCRIQPPFFPSEAFSSMLAKALWLWMLS